VVTHPYPGRTGTALLVLEVFVAMAIRITVAIAGITRLTWEFVDWVVDRGFSDCLGVSCRDDEVKVIEVLVKLPEPCCFSEVVLLGALGTEAVEVAHDATDEARVLGACFWLELGNRGRRQGGQLWLFQVILQRLSTALQ
jgi:hypothetical protein